MRELQFQAQGRVAECGVVFDKIRDSLDIVVAEFVAAVETSRKDKLKLTRSQLTTGEAWMGRDATKLGLVDQPETVDSVSARLIGRPPTAYRLFDLAKKSDHYSGRAHALGARAPSAAPAMSCG